MRLGISGNLTKSTLHSPLTPLFLLAALIAGIIALSTIPREEDPQISVPMVDIMVNAGGMRAADAAQLVTKPLEAIVKSINGVEHVYSETQDNQVLVTARFFVGTNEDDAIERVQAKINANLASIPTGVPAPIIIGRGINDVAIVTLTLTPKRQAAARWNDKDLGQLAEKLRLELVKTNNVGLTYLAGGADNQIRVEPDPAKLALYGVTLEQLVSKVRDANQTFPAGYLRDAGVERSVAVGQTLQGVPDIGLLVITTRDNRPVYVRDVANVVVGAAPVEYQVWNFAPDAKGVWHRTPAVTVAIAKRAGTNAVTLSQDLLARVKTLQGTLIPPDINVSVTRNYGQTANSKANELLLHLAIATISIVALIYIAIGRREAMVTAIVIPTTILLTLFASELMGYSINRVSLFALIFSIGILVDDAIVVVENIARHWGMHDGRPPGQAAVEAVAEVGNPTIVATLTVITALLPMKFVSGLMGPYMAPIPVNASAAMLFSFFVAMVIAPWLMLRVPTGKKIHEESSDGGKLGRFYRRMATPILASRRRAGIFLAAVGIATLLACAMFATKTVVVKLLPFDNKSELDVVLNLPEGSSLEETQRALFQAAVIAGKMPEMRSMQAYAGTAAPFNFNGLVRHYYLRDTPEVGELQLDLSDKSDRSRASHTIAMDLRRQLLQGLTLPQGSVLKVVEVPPGPPVLATLLAEIYGPDQATRRAEAEEVKKLFHQVPWIVDIDDSYGHPRPQLRISIDQDRLESLGVEQSAVYDTIGALLGSTSVGYSYNGTRRTSPDIVIGLPKDDLAWTARLASTPVPANAMPGSNRMVELGQLVHVTREAGSGVLFRRDGHFADMITGELAGAYEAPIYGMFAVDDLIKTHDWGKLAKPTVLFHGQPADEAKPSLLWDGEWEITYVTFRDMGIAFGVALVGIYVLVVAQFGSFKLPLVILTPIPLTLIGIVIGHIIFNAPFTATSMIGFIALAGIIVRNSILLVDFVRHGAGHGKTLREILLDAGAIRFKPILLTALAAMIGAVTILLDPIFQGLAISLLFGLASSTMLTVLVIPAIYVVLRDAEAVR